MHQSIGEIIRQVRHLRNLTQQELAGDRYSKSYVSAVEHNRISPSPTALRIFAERLGQPNGNFAELLQQPAVAQALSVPDTPALLGANGQIKRDDTAILLHTLLEQTEFAGFSPHRHLPTLSPNALTSLPQHLQARYYFLMGQEAKEERNLPVALRAFESALALAPAQELATILDEMGSCSFLLQAYLTALGYHLHALHLLSKTPFSRASTLLQLTVELHCGESYRALGAYQHALEHYESARLHLSAQHDLATAAELYSGLGYCIYAAIYPAIAPPAPAALAIDIAPELIEREFQRATGFMLQSRNFYQVSGDRTREANVRLMLATLLLDCSTWRRRLMPEGPRNTEQGQSWTSGTLLLDDAAEQCQQVLLGWHMPESHDEILPAELDTILYTALACLIRVSVQRAVLVRLEGSSVDVAYRERAFAAYLSQQVLDTLANPSLPWAVIQQAVTLSADTLTYRSSSLPRLPEIPTELSDTSPRSLLGLVEVYFAVGEVAEELGRAATVPNYAHDCYVQANQFFQAALSLARSAQVRGERDPGYLARLYQRCISLLEERALSSPTLYEETTKALQGVLKQAFWQLQSLSLENKIMQR